MKETLIDAVLQDNLSLFSTIMKTGGDPDTPDERGRTPLSYAAERGNVDIVNLLVEQNINFSHPDNTGKTPFAYAAEQAHYNENYLIILKALLGVDVDPDIPDYTGRTPLSYAAENGLLSTIEFLLINGANLDTTDNKGKTPLCHAAEHGKIAVVELLLNKGIAPNVQDETGKTPLSYAAEWAYIDKDFVTTLSKLLAKGADPNIPDKTGRTPLSYAVEKGSVDIINLLLAKGADPNIPDEIGRTPLSYAAEKGNLAAIDLLVTQRVPFDWVDDFSRSPLSYASAEGRIDVVKYLLAAGAIPNFIDETSNTPLSYAVENGHKNVISMLLRSGGGKEYFETSDSTVNERRKLIFSQFPILFELLTEQMLQQRGANATLPSTMQNAIDLGSHTAWKEVAEHYKSTSQLLQKIPPTYNQNFDSSIIIALVNNQLIKLEQLPALGTNQTELKQQQQALCDVLQACFALVDELGFAFQYKREDPTTYPKILTNLIKATANKGQKSWLETAKSIPEVLLREKTKFELSGIKDAIDDYVQTVFLPHALKQKTGFNVGKELETLFPEMVTSFLAGVPIDAICAFSDHWHHFGTAAKLNKVKDFANGSWSPMFVPDKEYIIDGQKVVATPLTTSGELNMEGSVLNHCVGGYTERCLKNKHHVISLRNEKNEPLSTIELIVRDDEQGYYVELGQHRMKDDKTDLTPLLKTAQDLLLSDIQKGNIAVDFHGLESQRQHRIQQLEKNSPDILLVGYDMKAPGKIDDVTKIYHNELKASQLSSNFDVLTGKGLEKEQKAEVKPKKTFVEKVGTPESSIQKLMDDLLGANQVLVSIDTSNAKARNGEVMIRISQDSSQTLETLRNRLNTILNGKKMTATFDEVNDTSLKIIGLAPRPIEQLMQQHCGTKQKGKGGIEV